MCLASLILNQSDLSNTSALPSMFLITFPCRSLIGLFVFCDLPLSYLVMLYNVPKSPSFIAAFSASLAKLLT